MSPANRDEVDTVGRDVERRMYVGVVARMNHFKRFNDAHGHLAGDELLGRFARVLEDQVRPEDQALYEAKAGGRNRSAHRRWGVRDLRPWFALPTGR